MNRRSAAHRIADVFSHELPKPLKTPHFIRTANMRYPLFPAHLRALVLVLGCTLAGASPIGASSDIPGAQDAPTHRQFQEALEAHLKATMVDPFVGSGPARDAREQLLLAMVRGLMRTPTSTPPSRVIEMAEALNAPGHGDAMTDLARALAQLAAGEIAIARHALEKTVPAILDGSAVPNVKALAAEALAKALARYPNQRDRALQLARQAVAFRLECLTSGMYDKPGLRVACFEITEISQSFLALSDQAALYQAVQNAGVDAWLVDVIGGKYHVTAAWGARGSSWAANVPEEGWQGFEHHLSEAETVLTRAHEAHPEFPEAAMMMIDVAMGQQDPKHPPRYWFDQAVKADFDWMEPYRRLLWALRPRWGGSHEEMIDFGKECLATRRFDTAVPMVYARAVRDVAYDQRWDWSGIDMATVYPLINELFVETAKLAQNDLDRQRYQTAHLTYAWRARAWSDAQRLVAALDDGRGVHEAISGDFGVSVLRDLLDDVEAYNTLPQTALTEAAALTDRGESAQAAQKYEQLQVGAKGHPRVERFLARRITINRWQAEFNTGEWVDVTPASNDLLGWRPVHGTWSVKDGHVVGAADSSGLLLDLEVDFNGPFEFEAQALFADVTEQTNAALILFHYDPEQDRYDTLGVNPKSGEASMRAVRNGRIVGQKRLTIGEVVRFNAQIWEDLVVARVNDEIVYVGPPVDRVFAPPFCVGLGSRDWFKGPTREFERIRIRRLTAMPKEIETYIRSMPDN